MTRLCVSWLCAAGADAAGAAADGRVHAAALEAAGLPDALAPGLVPVAQLRPGDLRGPVRRQRQRQAQDHGPAVPPSNDPQVGSLASFRLPLSFVGSFVGLSSFFSLATQLRRAPSQSNRARPHFGPHEDHQRLGGCEFSTDFSNDLIRASFLEIFHFYSDESIFNACFLVLLDFTSCC